MSIPLPTTGQPPLARPHTRLNAREVFNRVGMLPVLIVMYVAFYFF